jgi:DNA invertase Pin-like site-specific DNA recombinase
MKAAAYACFSLDTPKAESIEAQVNAIKVYCDKNNYTLVKVYADEALTGTNDNREQFL